MSDPEPTPPRGPIFLAALRSTLGRVPLWVTSWLVVLGLAWAMARPWAQWFGATLDHRYEPGAELAALSDNFRFDHRSGIEGLRSSGAAAAAALSVVLMLLGAFLAGGWLQVFLERTQGHSVRRFLWGAARYFWRFVRVWILTLFVLSFASWLSYGWPWKRLVLELGFGAAKGNLDALVSERTVVWLEWAQSGLYAALFALVLTWADYTRTRLALHNTRSALWAGLCTLGLLLLHPVRTLRPFLLILLLEVAVVALAGRFAWATNVELESGVSGRRILVLFLLAQAALLWQTISRAARYAAAVAVSRQLVQPLVQPDPWARRIGGPGGPQYPIDDSDEYGVSI